MKNDDASCSYQEIMNGELAHRGRAYFPTKMWLLMVKANPKLRPHSILELLVWNKKFLVCPFPAGDLNQNFVQVHEAFSLEEEGNPPIPRGKCIVGRIWNRPEKCIEGVPVKEGARLNHLGLTVLTINNTDAPVIIDLKSKITIVKEPEPSPSPSSELIKVSNSPITNKAYEKLEELIVACRHLKEFNLSLPIPKGILLVGPPGVGKTHLVRTLCQAQNIPAIVVNGPEMISPELGQSENNLAKIFSQAQSLALSAPCAVLFMDEIDSIAAKREPGTANDQGQVRLLSQLLTLLDSTMADFSESNNLLIIGATNRPNSLDPSIRRPGRFDQEISIEPPNESIRAILIGQMLNDFPGEIPINSIARRTIGYVPADLNALCRELIIKAIQSDGKITESILNSAMSLVPASLTREHRVPINKDDITWDDIGGMENVKSELKRIIEWPLVHAGKFRQFALRPPRGVLLYGPPGCSKTTIAKVLAGSGGFSFYSLSGATVYSCFVGEAERLIRNVFSTARQTFPALIFIDELDALVGRRGTGDIIQERILSTLLNEMDGIENLEGVIVLGATNRLSAIDSALLRPGRFDRLVSIPLPDRDGRFGILSLCARRTPFHSSMDLEMIADKTEGFSGAAIIQLIQEAAINAIRQGRDSVMITDLALSN